MKTVKVDEIYQNNYQYQLTEKTGENFHKYFRPELSPKEMLELGVFDGSYFGCVPKEFPKDWFTHAKLCSVKHDASLNYFKINASQPLSVWRAKGWIIPDDPRGWFQWYCRYYMGRRLPKYDDWQIKRWKQIRRHIGQIQKNCEPKDLDCRRKQRQAVLHWAYDSRKI